MMRLAFAISSITIGLIRKLSGANITITGEDLPESPLMFVANHFTRFETFVVPHILYEKFNRRTRSLADDSVFVGLLGKFMRRVGTISNKNKARDCIIVEDLLSGTSDWLIYPEGYMVKNKHITFDKGEFCTHSPEYEGPVHTGAAVMALKTKVLEERARRNHSESFDLFCAGLDVDPSKIDKNLKIKVVPISITYYPIRPGRNRILNWLDARFKQRNKRLFEEYEIELNLLMGSTMNLHFGKAIDLDSYIYDFLENEENIFDEQKVNTFIGEKRKALTNDVMQRVYSQMQIHFDHIFILSLVTMPTLKVCPSYLKTLIYKNTCGLRKLPGFNLHEEVKNELFKLILQENYDPYLSAINLALEQNILYKDSDGDYLFDRSLLEKEYPFHLVRVKNTLQVILNEIRWQDEIVQMAEDNSKFSEEELRNDNFRHICQRSWEYFEDEYKEFVGTVPSKEDKGAPIILYNETYEKGLVFAHGYMAAPKEIETLAHFLFEKGMNIYVPRLRGHATDPQALLNVSDKDWLSDFERAFTAMRQVCSKVYIGGFSTGGLLALTHAATYEVDGVIVINSALRLHDLRVSYVVPPLHFFNEMISYLHAKGIMEWIDNSQTEQPQVNYHKHPLASVFQLEKVMSNVEKTLSQVIAPILIIQGDNDPIVKEESATLIYDAVSSQEKSLLLLPRQRHSILADDQHMDVFDALYEFIEKTSQ